MSFDDQFRLSPHAYMAGLDFFTWTRHFHVLKALLDRVQGDVLEVGTGDGVLRRCARDFVRSYRVMDINPALQPDVVGNLLDAPPSLTGQFDAVVCTEVLEHLPFADFPRAIGQLTRTLRPGGLLFLTLPHRKGHWLLATPGQRLWHWRLPFWTSSLSAAYNRFVRRRIWIDPHHCWEIGDGRVGREQVASLLCVQGLVTQAFAPLPYCDFWVLQADARP